MKNPFSRNKQQLARSPDQPLSAGVAKTKQYDLWGSFNPLMFLPQKWQHIRQVDPTTFKNYSTNDLLDMLSVCHPEVSFALWQFLRVANSGITCKAKGVRGEDSNRGQKVLDQLLWNINHPPNTGRFQESRGLEKISLQILLNTLLRASGGCELVLNQLGKMDRLTPFDTGTISYKTENERIIPHQWQGASRGAMGWVPLDYPTVFIHALDEAIGDPYGRNPLASVPAMVAFQLGFLADLKAATHQVGYPRMDATIMEEIAVKNMPPTIQNDPVKQKEWMDKMLNDNIAMLRNLEPDSVPVHWDSMKMDIIGKGGGSTIKVDAVIAVIEKSLAASLKTLLTVLGRGENTSKESYAAEQKLYSRGIESIQKVVESILERALTMALNLEGVKGWVDVSFAPVDLRSELQVVAEKQTRQDIIITSRMRGAISDYEEMKMHREVLGMIGEPEGWEALVEERKEREANGGRQEDYPRHGSPPATQ